MQTTFGNVWPVSLLDESGRVGVVLDADRATRTFGMPTQAFLNIFERVVVKDGDLNADLLGLYSKMSVGRDLKARFGYLTTPRHVLSSRKNGCVWTPKGSSRLKSDVVDTYPFEVNIEQCPSSLWGDCFEMLFGPGNDVRDMLSTPEGRQLYEQFLRSVFVGVGNSVHMLLNFSNHSAITTANASGFYKVSAEEWADFLDQMTSTQLGGIVTLLDRLADEGEPGFDVPIPDSFNANGQFTGDIIALLERLKSKAKGAMRALIRSEFRPNQPRPIIILSDALFDAYQNYIVTNFSSTSEAYRYRLLGVDGQIITAMNILSYMGLPVARWEASAQFDEVVGTTSHRAAIVAPGAFGIAYSGDIMQQYDGMNMRIVQRLDPPYQGKIFLDTTFRLGAAVEPEFVVYGALIKSPV